MESTTRTTLNIDKATSDNLATLVKYTNTTKADCIRQTANAFTSNTNALTLIKTYLGSVNIANIIDAGIEVELNKARRRLDQRRYDNVASSRRKEANKQLSFYSAVKELAPVSSSVAILAEAIAEKYAYLSKEAANFASKKSNIINMPYEHQCRRVSSATLGNFAVDRQGNIVKAV